MTVSKPTSLSLALTFSATCRGFSLHIKDQTPSRMVRTLNIHMCNLPLSELSDIKGRPEVWEKVGVPAEVSSGVAWNVEKAILASGRPDVRIWCKLSACHDPSPARLAEMRHGLMKAAWWLQALSLHVAPRHSEVKHQVSVPITASCLMIEFADFWTDLNEASTEVLQCPRCSHLVSDPHGVCRFCRENAFQCRHCR